MAAKKTPAAPKKKVAAAPRAKAAPAEAQAGNPAADELARAFSQEYRAASEPVSDVVVLDADVAPHFRNSRAVNEALRALLRIVRQIRDTGGA